MMNLERKAANYLDPRWKGVHLRLTNRLQQTKVDMKAKYLGELFNSQREEQVRVSGLEQEMRRYEASGNPGRNVDVLDFWKQNQDVFPLLAKMARIVLAIPASSAKSEHVFSTGGLIVTPRRFAHKYIGMMILVCNQ